MTLPGFLGGNGSGMPESAFNFLVVRLSSIGDIVHALPAVAALGETYPQAKIHWAVERRYAGLLEGNPYVHRVLKFDTLNWRKRLASGATLEEIGRGILALREIPFDAAIDFQGLWKSAVIAWLSRSRERLGFAEYWLREPSAAALYTDKVSPHGRRHVIEMNMALVERLGAGTARWQFPLPHSDEDDRDVAGRLAATGAREFLIVNPGGGWLAKRWAPENYAELVRRISAVFTGRILLTGAPDETPVIQQILGRAATDQACYFPSTLVQFIALARRARLFVGGDTGPLQLAAAVGTPVVALYGPTDPARNGPFSPRDIALSNRGPIDHTRRGAHPEYLPGIPVEAVFEAVCERLAGERARENA